MRNKGQGVMVSAVIAAGLLLRPVGSVGPEPTEATNAGTATSAVVAPDAAQGPWMASCDYWAAARTLADHSSKKPAEIHNAFDVKNNLVDLHVKLDGLSGEREAKCGGETPARWGFPDAGPVNVTAIIATVPDPVHSHMALMFDRTVAAILQAAADNGYVSSYYWLPWKIRGGPGKGSDSAGEFEPAHDPERERLPGLIILKNVPDSPSRDSFFKVIYLFLVAETPTLGVDGFQLQGAFSLETELAATLRGSGQFSRGDGRVAIVGPQFSGSAASLRAGMQRAWDPKLPEFELSASTGTLRAAKELEKAQELTPGLRISFLSFSDHTDFVCAKLFKDLHDSGYDLGRVALLIEDSTTYGSWSSAPSSKDKADVEVIRFPREIFLLRNAHSADGRPSGEPSSNSSTTNPSLHLSLRDSGGQDTVPKFSAEHTPVSLESELTAVGRLLHRNRSQYIVIVASNPLDQIFLAQFLQRACPDARLIFLGADLLSVHEVDVVPFIGSVTVSPYSLIGLGRTVGRPSRAYPDSLSIAQYNAAGYTFWHNKLGRSVPILQSYRNPLAPEILQPPLWATVLGRDGYYPLAILSPCSTNEPAFLRRINPKDGTTSQASCEAPAANPQLLTQLVIYPSLSWDVLCALVSAFCLTHMLMMVVASYWSPFTRDLAIRDNDQPERRSTYVHIASAALVAMAVIISFPAISLAFRVHFSPAGARLAIATLGLGALVFCVTMRKTFRFMVWRTSHEEGSTLWRLYDRVLKNAYPILVSLTWISLALFGLRWWDLCSTESAGNPRDLALVGLSFSFRAIHPSSGVSPVSPVLLLLLSWYLWAFFKTWRLRFSDDGRPRLPGNLSRGHSPFFVPDESLNSQGPLHGWLYRNITCPMIIREILYRFWRARGGKYASLAIDFILVSVIVAAVAWYPQFAPIDSVDHFLWQTGTQRSTPFEFSIAVLGLPLIALCLAGWIRLIIVWKSLKSELLERLENQPLRFAFNRLNVMGWMSMLRHGGLQEQWRDMARSVESMRQMLHSKNLRESISETSLLELQRVNKRATDDIATLRKRLEEAQTAAATEHDYQLITKIECDFAEFAQKLLTMVLIPYWSEQRLGLVSSEECDELPIKAKQSETGSQAVELHAGPATAEPMRILLTEEFVAIRYISLIRSVLSNMRYLMIFVSASFVLAMVAWNSYPFQPRQLGDGLFTGCLILLGSGMVWVLAQMYRNPILSRITDTKANELGWDFYLRIASYGAVPVLAWLTYQFPDIARLISKFIQPGVPVIK